MPSSKRRNPFFALLVPVGMAFTITACAYGFMAFVSVNSLRNEAGQRTAGSLFRWLNAHGTTAIIVELAILAVLTVGAIATDGMWSADQDSSSKNPHQ